MFSSNYHCRNLITGITTFRSIGSVFHFSKLDLDQVYQTDARENLIIVEQLTEMQIMIQIEIQCTAAGDRLTHGR